MFEYQFIVGEHTISPKAKMSLTILNSEMVESEYKSQCILPIVLEGYAKVEHGSEWRTNCEMKSQLEKWRGQSFSMIQGQCMQVILDKMKYDSY